MLITKLNYSDYNPETTNTTINNPISNIVARIPSNSLQSQTNTIPTIQVQNSINDSNLSMPKPVCNCCACKQLSRIMDTKSMRQFDVNSYYSAFMSVYPNHNQCNCTKLPSCGLIHSIVRTNTTRAF